MISIRRTIPAIATHPMNQPAKNKSHSDLDISE